METEDFEAKSNIINLDVCVNLEETCAKVYILEETSFGELCEEVIIKVRPHGLELVYHISLALFT